jgi:Periplasmic binding protein
VRRSKPDLVLTFSDLQAPIVADLIRAGVAVHAFNQRDIAGILTMIRTLGALVGVSEKAEALARCYERRLTDVAAGVPNHLRPRVYFEEWDQPLISGIGWVSELIEIAGGEDVFRDLARQKAAKDRVVSPEAVIAAAPDAILASSCGKKVVPEKIRQRPGWSKIPAVRTNRIVEIKSPLIPTAGACRADRRPKCDPLGARPFVAFKLRKARSPRRQREWRRSRAASEAALGELERAGPWRVAQGLKEKLLSHLCHRTSPTHSILEGSDGHDR